MVSSGKPVGAVAAGDLAAHLGADHAVDVADGQIGLHLLAALDGGLAQIKQHLAVEGFFQPVVLGNRAAAADLGGTCGW